MEESIFRLPNSYTDDGVVESYTFIGSQDFLDDNNFPRIKNVDDHRVLAKKRIRNNGSTKYSIRLDTSNRKLFNPNIYDINARIENTRTVFKTVNSKTFNMYINFLKTKNQSWLLNAERESE